MLTYNRELERKVGNQYASAGNGWGTSKYHRGWNLI